MDGLLDTSVVVDIYRGHAPAVDWLSSHTHLQIGLTSLTWMEVVTGAENKDNQDRVIRLLDRFPMAQLSQTDILWAMEQLQTYQLSQNVGIPDCLIAAPSHRLQLPLFTRNLKHFTPLLGNLAREPYA